MLEESQYAPHFPYRNEMSFASPLPSSQPFQTTKSCTRGAGSGPVAFFNGGSPPITPQWGNKAFRRSRAEKGQGPMALVLE